MGHISLETCLTPNMIKNAVFGRDENYIQALSDLRHCWTDPGDLVDLLWNTASLILRPDAVAGGQAANTLPILRALGFVPVAVAPVWLSLHQTRELWRYQANVSTPERLRLLDLIMTSGASLYVLFRDTAQRQSAPATVHLTYLKGTAIVENRKRWHLRTLAGPKVTNILSYVHVSDDPADLLREIALLFPKRRWLDLLREAEQQQDRTDRVRSSLALLQSTLPRDVLRSLPCSTPQASIDWPRILNDQRLVLSDDDLAHRWRYLVETSRHAKVFVTGNAYDGRTATVPDDTELSLSLDGHLIFPEFGPR